MAGIDFELIRHTLKIAQETGLNEVELEQEGYEFHAKLAPNKVKRSAKSTSRASTSEIATSVEVKEIKSSAVGIFRIAAEIEVGKTLKEGDKVGAIEALGISNDVNSQFSGEVVEICLSDQSVVDFGRVLIKVKSS